MTRYADARHVIRSAQQQQDRDFPGLARVGQQQVLHGHALVMRHGAAQDLAIGGLRSWGEGVSAVAEAVLAVTAWRSRPSSTSTLPVGARLMTTPPVAPSSAWR